MCCVVFVFSSHSFWTPSSLDVPAGVTQEEGHTGFLTHLLSAVFLFLFISFLVRKIPFAGIELTSQRVRGLRGTSELPGRPVLYVALSLKKVPV